MDPATNCPSRAAACGGSRAGKCSGSLDAAEGLPRGASPWTGAMHRAAKPAGMMLDDQLAGDHAFDPQGSSLEFTEKGSILWKGFKIGDKGVMAAPDGAPPSSGVLALPPLPCRPCPAALALPPAACTAHLFAHLWAGITTADINFQEEIGRGASSTVFRALVPSSPITAGKPSQVAVKVGSPANLARTADCVAAATARSLPQMPARTYVTPDDGQRLGADPCPRPFLHADPRVACAVPMCR